MAPTLTTKERLIKLETRFDEFEKKLDSQNWWLKSIGVSIILYIITEVMKGISG